MGFSTVVRGRTELPEIDASSGDREPDDAIDIFLDYPEDGTERLDTGAPLRLESPEGFSGGGLWDQGFTTSELWSPENAVLFAIQSSWNESQRYVRAIQIIHWIDLLRSSIPQLRELIDNEIPSFKLQSQLD